MPRTHRCARDAPSLLTKALGGISLLGDMSTLPPRSGPWNLSDMIKANEPALLRNSFGSRQWTWHALRDLLAGDTLEKAIHLVGGHAYYVPDPRAALDPFMYYHVPQRRRDVRAESMLDDLARAAEAKSNSSSSSSSSILHFGAIPDGLREALHPHDELLYADADALRRAEQFTWLSSPGVRTHTHFECVPRALP
jgi:hypothetical protein